MSPNDDNPKEIQIKLQIGKLNIDPVDFIIQKIENEKGLDPDRVRGLNNSGYMRESVKS